MVEMLAVFAVGGSAALELGRVEAMVLLAVGSWVLELVPVASTTVAFLGVGGPVAP
jgi:hypothetical protein